MLTEFVGPSESAEKCVPPILRAKTHVCLIIFIHSSWHQMYIDMRKCSISLQLSAKVKQCRMPPILRTYASCGSKMPPSAGMPKIMTITRLVYLACWKWQQLHTFGIAKSNNSKVATVTHFPTTTFSILRQLHTLSTCQVENHNSYTLWTFAFCHCCSKNP